MNTVHSDFLSVASAEDIKIFTNLLETFKNAYPDWSGPNDSLGKCRASDEGHRELDHRRCRSVPEPLGKQEVVVMGTEKNKESFMCSSHITTSNDHSKGAAI